jgi:hypothetical protein
MFARCSYLLASRTKGVVHTGRPDLNLVILSPHVRAYTARGFGAHPMHCRTGNAGYFEKKQTVYGFRDFLEGGVALRHKVVKLQLINYLSRSSALLRLLF